MGNTWGGSGVKRDHSEAFSKGDASELVRDKSKPLYYMNWEGRKVAFGIDLSQEHVQALGNIKWELDAAQVDYSGIPVLTRGDVFAIKPPKRPKFTEPMRDTVEVVVRLLYYNNPPDDATIDKMGPVCRLGMFRMYLPRWRRNHCSNTTTVRQKSTDCFVTFKSMALKLNDGKTPDESFWREQLRVRYKEWKRMEDDKRLFYTHLHDVVLPSTAKGPSCWVTNNKKWLEASGVFSAWEKHRASADFVRMGGHAGEVKGDCARTRKALNERLQGKEYIDDDDSKRYKVLVVRFDEKRGENVALCYEARLADPTKNQKHAHYINRLVPVSFAMSIEDVDDAIARTPKRARS